MIHSYFNDKPLSFEELLSCEIDIYNSQKIPNDTLPCLLDLNEVFTREQITFHDKDYNLPQAIFLIKIPNFPIFVGRKIRSILHIEGKINAINCSMITADMLLGVLDSLGQSERNIYISFFPLNACEKLSLFDIIKSGIRNEIVYPFLFRHYDTGLEEVTPESGWSVNPDKVRYLADGEAHLRCYSKHALSPYLSKENVVVFDPACSTGTFLYSLKKNFPLITTIGQDLSADMVAYARPFVDYIYCGDSINTPIKDNSIDVIIFRFLNSEVVSQSYSRVLFKRLLLTVKYNGIVVLFGHTPVLLDSDFFESNGCTVLQSIGYCEKYDCIFQYYILRKAGI